MSECHGVMCGHRATWRLTSKGRGMVEGHDVVLLLCGHCKERATRLLRRGWTCECIEEARAKPKPEPEWEPVDDGYYEHGPGHEVWMSISGESVLFVLKSPGNVTRDFHITVPGCGAELVVEERVRTED